MNYYDEIKNKILDNEIYCKVKDYSKEKYKLKTYIEIGELLYSANNKYGDSIIKEYSQKLSDELNKKYSVRYLFDVRKLYLFVKVHPLGAQLTISHCRLLFSLNDNDKIDYYIDQVLSKRLAKRELEIKIKNNEYERIPFESRNKIIKNEDLEVKDLVPNPIIIRNKNNIEVVNEKILKKLILENIDAFLLELGNNFCYIGNEYKIKIGDRYNYIDMLLYNIEFNCYVVVELKVTELKKEYIGQIEVYMNYIDSNLKKFNQDKTIGIIICKKDNKYVIGYRSDERIISREYELM
jgi:predicted nuclease of restriction endonuclease-like (RecB) superfamily